MLITMASRGEETVASSGVEAILKSSSKETTRLRMIEELVRKYPVRKCENDEGIFGFDLYETKKWQSAQEDSSFYASAINHVIVNSAFGFMKEYESEMSCSQSSMIKNYSLPTESVDLKSPINAYEICSSWNSFFKEAGNPNKSESEKQSLFWKARQKSMEFGLWKMQSLQSQNKKLDKEGLSAKAEEGSINAGLAQPTEEWIQQMKMQGTILPQLNISTCYNPEGIIIGDSGFDKKIAGLLMLTFYASDSEEEMSESDLNPNHLADQLAEEIIKFGPNINGRRVPASK